MNNNQRRRTSNKTRDQNILPKGFIWIIGIHVAFVFVAATIAITTAS
tara:strand:+ start:118 stop:258 length:141 start_codon:yes stop_codon:yes gene_type:complete